MSQRIPLPMPNGWFRVAESDELAAGQVLAVRLCGQDLVLFRGQTGQAHVMDAHCCHLGAHLGHGGKVEGDCIRCPFHAWLYDGDGKCVDIPYAKRIPAKAAVRSWPVTDKTGIVMAWYHSEGWPPQWEIPEVPEFGSADWTEPAVRRFKVRSHPQEQMENIVDPAHFQYVHGTSSPTTTEAETDGHIFRIRSGIPFSTPQGQIEGTLTVESHGFGLGVTRFTGIVDTLLVITGTCVDEEEHETVIRFSVRKTGDEAASSVVGEAFIAEIERQYGQDMPIWENKVHLERPALCEADGPIGQLRAWAKQFYPAGQAG